MRKIIYKVYLDAEVNTRAARLAIEQNWDNILYKDGSFTPLQGKIQWRNDLKPFETMGSAKQYILTLDRDGSGFIHQIAVPFYRDVYNDEVNEAFAKSKKESDLLKQLNDVYYTPGKTKFKYVTCRNCGSKLAVEYLKGNTCPLCQEDIRPKPVIQKVEEQREKDLACQKELNRLLKKYREKCWLLKVEYYTK